MASDSSSNGSGGFKGLLDELPVDRLKEEFQHGLSALGEKAVKTAGDKLSGLTDRLEDVADQPLAVAEVRRLEEA